ncbi:TolC family protein, partial [Caulobacter sp. B11]|uniref:TolC family protein n=1 Tax=Caulobacter sp. B11 TaxID=2048899 RepID=UPI00191BB8B7
RQLPDRLRRRLRGRHLRRRTPFGRAARATAEGTRASLRAVQLTVASEIALNYLDAREAQARLRIARDTLSTLDETVEITGWRLQAGLVGSLDLERARQLRAQTAASIPAIETAYAAATNRLAVLLDETPGAMNGLLEPAAEALSPPAVFPAAIPAEVIRRRPDVALANRPWRRRPRASASRPPSSIRR